MGGPVGVEGKAARRREVPPEPSSSLGANRYESEAGSSQHVRASHTRS